MPHPAARRAVLYGRVSKLARGTEHDDTTSRHTVSVDRQIDEMQRWAARDNVEIVGVHRDDGISASRYASTKVREGWQQTMQAILNGDANELWAWEISRATRDRPVWASLVNACIAQRVLISVGDRVHDPTDPDDGFMLDLQAALAVRESAVTSKRILSDVAARAAKGRPHGKIPYGYRRDYEIAGGKLRFVRQEPDPDTAPIVAEIARRILAGEAMYAIAHDLNQRGVPSPEAVRARRMHGPDHDITGFFWRGDEVRGQALSPAAAGQRVHRGVVVADGTWPAIISLADHAALIAQIRGGDRTWFGPAKHLLTGIAECGVCTTPLRRTKNRGYPSYSCPGPRKRGDSCVSRIQEPLDAMATIRVVERLEDPEFLERLAGARSDGDERTASVVEELAALRTKLEQYVTAAAAVKAGLAADTFARVVDDISGQITAKELELRDVAQVPAMVMDLAGPGAAERWADLTIDERRFVVRSMLRVVVHRSRRGRGVRGFDTETIELIDL